MEDLPADARVASAYYDSLNVTGSLNAGWAATAAAYHALNTSVMGSLSAGWAVSVAWYSSDDLTLVLRRRRLGSRNGMASRRCERWYA